MDKCDVCGRSLMIEGPNGPIRAYGVEIRLGSELPALDEQLAAYFAPYELGHTYTVCHACWLKALGVKPDGPVGKRLPDK